MLKFFRNWPKELVMVILALLLVRLLLAALLPMTQDEAYYLAWSGVLDWGYLDHPPGVAWVGALGHSIAPGLTAIAGRLGPIVITMVSIPFFVGLCRMADTRPATMIAATCLYLGSLFAIVSSILQTPDAILFALWVIACHEAAAALAHDPRRWITAGIAAGLALLGKYTAILLPLVFLLVLLFRARPHWRTPWPYAGLVACLLVFSPHILWNAQHEWATMRFQVGRGFAKEYLLTGAETIKLPTASKATRDSEEFRLAELLRDPDQVAKPRPVRTAWEMWERQTREFFGGQLALWGLGLIPVILALYRRWRGRQNLSSPSNSGTNGDVRWLLACAAVVPLLFFGSIAMFTPVEANWPAMYVIGAAVWLAPFLAGWRRLLWSSSLGNALMLLALVVLTSLGGNSASFAAKSKHRLADETSGYQALSQVVAPLPGVLCADTYQMVAMLRFYTGRPVCHWPGIARPSEFLRRPELNAPVALDVSSGFWLVLANRVPAAISGFAVSELTEFRDCADGRLVETRAHPGVRYQNRCRAGSIHTWYLARYEPR